jgi:oligopeptide transport system ATP-binding protein
MVAQEQQVQDQSPTGDTLVEVRDLKMYFPVKSGVIWQKKVADIKAVDGVSFTIRKGETLGLVGESGCGKTTTGRCLLQLNRPTEGEVLFEGTDENGNPTGGMEDLTKMTNGQVRVFRRRMQMIFQDPYSSLNPRMNCGNIVGEPLLIHKMVKSRSEFKEQVSDLLQTVGLNPYFATRFPHEFSGGQRQRIGVARALAVRPSLIVCDEPVSALDVSIQAQVINLLEELQEQFNLTYLFIAHDLSVVRHISDRIAVMYLGKMVELADRTELYENPLHPYTKALLSAVPIPDPVIEAQRERVLLVGDVPSPLNPPSGCVFHTRCPIAIEECSDGIPEFRDMGNEHYVACIRV